VRAASFIALVTLASKVLGALRDWLLLTRYGAGLGSDAYLAALQIPSFALILLGGLGGPFHTATVSVLTRLQTGSAAEASSNNVAAGRRVAGTFLTLTMGVFSVFALLVFLNADAVMRLILPDNGPSQPQQLITQAAAHLRIMSPMLVLGGVCGILYGLLNVHHQFFWPSFSPAVFNLAMVAAMLAFPNDPTGQVLAWSSLVGALLMIFCQLPGVLRLGYPLTPTLAGVRDPELKTVGRMLGPASVGTAMGQVNVYVDMFFTALLPAGGWTAIVMGNRLIQLPLGILQTALLVPIFPRLTEAAAAQDTERLRRQVRQGIISLWMVSFPILAVLLTLCAPLVRLLFQHGRFDADDTRQVSVVVMALGLSIPFYFARDTLTRVFYAFQDTRTPLWVGLTAIGANALLDATLVGPLGVAGVALATSVVTALNTGLLWCLLRRYVVLDPVGLYLKNVGWVGLASLAMAAVLLAMRTWFPLDWAAVACIPLGMAVYLLLLWCAPVAETRGLLRMLQARLLRRPDVVL
jgi:putative peptidoglycan lipid II flippase